MKVKKRNNLLIIGISILIVLAIIAFATRKKEITIDYDKMTDEEVSIAIQEKLENIELSDLSEMEERDRMEYYVATFIKAIENDEYEDAYEMLYSDFKKNFFPTLSSFEEYARNKIP